MKKTMLLFSLLFFVTTPSRAQEDNSLADAPATEASSDEVAEQSSHTEQPTVSPEKPPQSNAVQSFVRFVRVLVAILSNEKFQNNARMIEKLIASMLQTSYQIMQTNQQRPTPQTRAALENDEALLQELCAQMSQEPLAMLRTAPNKPPQVDQDTQEIIGHFAGVVNNFFRIVADPENPETVPASIIGMIAGMVNIGAVAMKKDGPPAAGADYSVFEKYAQDIDSNIKEQMYAYILQRRDELGIVVNVAI